MSKQPIRSVPSYLTEKLRPSNGVFRIKNFGILLDLRRTTGTLPNKFMSMTHPMSHTVC